MLLHAERKAVVTFGKKMIDSGLVKGTGGNISITNEAKDMLAISPTGIAYERMRPEEVIVLDRQGKTLDGALTPSSETDLHLGLINSRPDIRAIVHTHSPFATTIACLGWDLPAVHYLIGEAGYQVPCARYETFGTKALSDSVCETIRDGNAVLMANHGLVCVGTTIDKAFSVAEQIEFVARIYYQAKTIGDPDILNKAQMTEVMQKFKTYGQQKPGTT